MPNSPAGLLGGGGFGDQIGGGGSQVRGQGGGIGDLLQNPIARAALGGIAATAMKKMPR